MACVCDAKKQVMRCKVCGDEVPMPLGNIDWVVGVIRAFEKAHPHCAHSAEQTWLAPAPAPGQEGGE